MNSRKTRFICLNYFFSSFSYTFERVQQNSEKLWWYERYTAVHDYEWRIPSPFNLFFIPFRIRNKCLEKGCCQQSQSKFSYIKFLKIAFKHHWQHLFHQVQYLAIINSYLYWYQTIVTPKKILWHRHLRIFMHGKVTVIW